MAFLGLPIWLLVSIVLVILIGILIRTTNQVYVLYLIRDNFFYFFLFLVFIFLAISLTHIHTTYDIDLTSLKGVGEAMKIYFLWFKGVLHNLGDITGYASKQNWFLNNATQ